MVIKPFCLSPFFAQNAAVNCHQGKSVNPPEEAAVIDKKLSREQKAILETRLAQFEATLSTSPKDETALEVSLGIFL
ncbi:hypothetical protein Goarm_005090 [Gossypium armourianum]|uniref:Uncharacterized protein n=1 Tax=Gossypium armourianum TaxID=34283 RepID=A0A7J9JYX0_9ROSI|nr:hypothetical protein [Gossypium armourianum]